jgi:hypothetical protein
VSLVLWRRKADNAHSNPLFYGPSPLNSQHLHFQFPITSLLKILLEVVAIGRKNAGKDPDRWSVHFLKILSATKVQAYVHDSGRRQNKRLFSPTARALILLIYYRALGQRSTLRIQHSNYFQ